jgi:hypothetical protein
VLSALDYGRGDTAIQNTESRLRRTPRIVDRSLQPRVRNPSPQEIVSHFMIVASARTRRSSGTRRTGAGTLFVVAMLWAVGCERQGPPAAIPPPADEIIYSIPAEGLSLRRVVEDAERILGRKIPCSECAQAQTRPIKIAGRPRAARAEALRMFQAIFVTVLLSLVEPSGTEPSLILECLDTSGRSIRKGPFVWIDDVAAEQGDAPVSTVILTKHVPPSEVRDALIPLFDGRLSYCNELPALRGWIVRGPPATILKILAVVRALDKPPPASRSVGPTTR